MGLTPIPHYSTRKKFSARIVTSDLVDSLLARILTLMGDSASEEVAIDSTGMDSNTASAHYLDRRGSHRHQYVKISLAVTCVTLLAVSLVVTMGPGNDRLETREFLTRSAEQVQPRWLDADAGYDAEWEHVACREHGGVKSLIPPVIHRDDGTVGGKYRSKMTDLPRRYGRRWRAESFMSGLKRTTGWTLAARSGHRLLPKRHSGAWLTPCVAGHHPTVILFSTEQITF